ncbi:MAG: SAF domain-containing protein, partial [Acidimicrobiia bacterium]
MATQMPAIGGRRWRGGQRAMGGWSARLWGKGLPSGRAVIGGLLVAVAMLTVTVASRRDSSPTHRVLVAARDVPAGTVLTVDDLAATEIDVPDAQLDLLVTDPAQLTGRPLVRALHSGELIAASDPLDPASAPQRSAVTVRLEPERALAGSVRTGEHIAVVATFDG